MAERQYASPLCVYCVQTMVSWLTIIWGYVGCYQHVDPSQGIEIRFGRPCKIQGHLHSARVTIRANIYIFLFWIEQVRDVTNWLGPMLLGPKPIDRQRAPVFRSKFTFLNTKLLIWQINHSNMTVKDISKIKSLWAT